VSVPDRRLEIRTPRSRLGEMINLYCASRGISEREIARILGMNKATLNRLMRGQEITLSKFVPLLNWLLGKRSDGLP
jgi:transcriptional regulator with XRE-family HTH domain